MVPRCSWDRGDVGCGQSRTVCPTGGVVPVSSPPVGAPRQWRDQVHQGDSTVPLCEPHQPPPREFAPRRRDCDKVNGVATFALNESAHR